MGPSENRYTRSKSRSHDVSIHVFFCEKNTIYFGGLDWEGLRGLWRTLEDMRGLEKA